MTRWQFILTDPTGTPQADLTHAHDRKLRFYLSDVDTAEFKLSGVDRQALEIHEYATDVIAYRDGTPLLRARIGPDEDDLDGTTHDVDVNAFEYRGLLGRRLLYENLTWDATDTGLIVADLIAYTQSYTPPDGGDLGITTTGTTGHVPAHHTATAGATLQEAIDAALTGGGDWSVLPDLACRVWPSRGAGREFVAEWGGSISKVKRTVDPASFANVVRVTGATGLTPAVAAAPDLDTRPEGPIAIQVGNPDLKTQAMVDAAAPALLARWGTLAPGYECTVKPGAWTPDDLWLGDTGHLVIRNGRLDVDTHDRVVQIDIDVNDNGEEDSVVITFGTRRLDIAQHIRTLPMRLSRLERL